MSEQANRALELAARLDSCASVDFDGVFVPSAAELRRLHSVNAELLEALQRLSAQAERLRLPGQPQSDAEKNANAVIFRALGQ